MHVTTYAWHCFAARADPQGTEEAPTNSRMIHRATNGPEGTNYGCLFLCKKCYY